MWASLDMLIGSVWAPPWQSSQVKLLDLGFAIHQMESEYRY